jgi:hypothetical protein
MMHDESEMVNKKVRRYVDMTCGIRILSTEAHQDFIQIVIRKLIYHPKNF